MTAVIATPDLITRQEQKAMNAIMSLDFACPTQTMLERPNLLSFNCEWFITKTPDGIQIFVGRLVLPLDDVSAVPAGSKPWIQARDIPQSAIIPAYYSTN